MHRSRLYGIFIDTPEAAASEAVAFWSAALGTPSRPVAGEEQFTMLPGALAELVVGVQAVADAPRYHVDIETDNVDAEVDRLLDLGATEVARWLDCHVLRAPGGHLVCVIPVHSAPDTFAAHASTWADTVTELGSRVRPQPAPAAVVWSSLVHPRDPAARPWLHLLEDEVAPRILESREPSLVVWSSLWPDRPDETIRFDIEPDGPGCQLRWTLLTAGPSPTVSKLGHMRLRVNVLINDRLRRSYGQ